MKNRLIGNIEKSPSSGQLQFVEKIGGLHFFEKKIIGQLFYKIRLIGSYNLSNNRWVSIYFLAFSGKWAKLEFIFGFPSNRQLQLIVLIFCLIAGWEIMLPIRRVV